MTPAWKQRVADQLAENARTNVYPRNQTELANAIGVDRSAITKMMQATSSKLVDLICSVMPVGEPMQEATVEPPVVELVKQLTEDQQRDVMEFIRKYVLRS